MDERKQDAINESMLKALMEEHEKDLQIQREVLRNQNSNSTFETLANRIIDDARSGQTHRSVANSLLSNIGVENTLSRETSNPLRHVGQRAKKNSTPIKKDTACKEAIKSPSTYKTSPLHRPKTSTNVPANATALRNNHEKGARLPLDG